MGHSIAVMNTKGGVGKSTVVMALAETLSEFHKKNVLVVDSDSQTSISTMLMHMSRWEQLESQHKTLVDYLSKMVLGPGGEDWRNYIATGVSDLDETQSVYLVPSHMELSLFEREISAEKREQRLRDAVRGFLAETRRMFDFVIIDCPPGLSVLTECWLRECDYFLPPTKPDYLAVRGLSILQRFRELNADTGFAQLLGVLINLKDARISSEEEWHRKLAAEPANKVFQTAIPRRAYIQRAADFETSKRTYIAKYPGDAGQTIRLVTAELLARVEGRAFELPKPAGVQQPAVRPAAPPPVPSRAAPAQQPAVAGGHGAAPVTVAPQPSMQLAPAPVQPAVARPMAPAPAAMATPSASPAGGGFANGSAQSAPSAAATRSGTPETRPMPAQRQSPPQPAPPSPQPVGARAEAVASPSPAPASDRPNRAPAPVFAVTAARPPQDEVPLDLVPSPQAVAARAAGPAEAVATLGAPMAVGPRPSAPAESPIALGPANGARPQQVIAPSHRPGAVNGHQAPPPKPMPMTLGTPERVAPPPVGFVLRRPQIAKILLGRSAVPEAPPAVAPADEIKAKAK